MGRVCSSAWCPRKGGFSKSPHFPRASAGAFEREAIRPFVLGRFADMLMAVERHPAMLFYLDNQQSIGPAWTWHKNLLKSLSPIVDCGVHYVDVMCQMTGARPVRSPTIASAS